jgi:trk system potassium uptake protein
MAMQQSPDSLLFDGQQNPSVQRFLRFLLGGICFIVTVTLVLDYGFLLPTEYQKGLHLVEIAIAFFFGIYTLFEIFTTGNLSHALKKHKYDLIFLCLLVAEFLYLRCCGYSAVSIYSIFLLKIYLLSLQVYILYKIVSLALQSGRTLFFLSLAPATMLALSFFLLILIGTFLLWMPTATHGALSPNITLIDSLFTATSAVCVTGLIVVDTATVFSRFGQSLILVLIQLGALGIMTYVGIFAFTIGKNYSLHGRNVLQSFVGNPERQRVSSLLKVILLTFLGCEVLGALVLFAALYDPATPTGETLFTAVFHAISAFANAGFSTFSDSLERFADSPLVMLTISALIIAGGLGFSIFYDVADGLRVWFFRRKRKFSFSLHTRLVVKITGYLIVVGTVLVWFAVDHTGMSGGTAVLVSFFHSVTTRTAGFNSIPLLSVAPWCLCAMLVFMFIGGAPGGTAGGVKVSTLGLLYYASKSLLKGRPHVEIMKRTIPGQAILTAFVLCGIAVAYVTLAVIALIWAEPDLPFFHLVFEVVSAFGTVGLSLGVTPQLSVVGKLIIIITMYVGRVGPLTVFLAMARKRDSAIYRYPDESIAIG